MQGDWLGPVILAAFALLPSGSSSPRFARRAAAAAPSSKRRVPGSGSRREEGAPPRPPRRPRPSQPPHRRRKRNRRRKRKPPRPQSRRRSRRPKGGVRGAEAVARGRPGRRRRCSRGWRATGASFVGRLNQISGRHPKVDRAVLDELEEALLTADVGVSLTASLVAELKTGVDGRELCERGGGAAGIAPAHARRPSTRRPPRGISLAGVAAQRDRPAVILFVGVNGVGKTTTIGKVAAQLKARGQQASCSPPAIRSAPQPSSSSRSGVSAPAAAWRAAAATPIRRASSSTPSRAPEAGGRGRRARATPQAACTPRPT